MIKQIKQINDGMNSAVSEFLVNRLLPYGNVPAVGPFVFLDHLYPAKVKADKNTTPDGTFAHPHRGIATFSYVFEGGLSHYDSLGNFNQIGAGGVQWMKAGKGIIHDEQPFAVNADKRFHSVQFWINLPAANKPEAPEYMALQSEEIPEINLPENAGTLRVLAGEFGCMTSPVKTYSRQFVYHIKLNPKSAYRFPAKTGLEYAAFVPAGDIYINGQGAGKSKIAIFESGGDEFDLKNPDIVAADLLIFGGEPYSEPIVSRGPFVMNTSAEIAAAYRDFFEGKYGRIIYPKLAEDVRNA